MTLFKITGSGSSLSLRLEQPIHLDENKDYFLGLKGFYGGNYVPNISEPIQVIFHQHDPENGEGVDFQTLHIGRGNYYMKNLENLFLDFIKSNYKNLATLASDKDSYYLRLNETTGKTEMKMPIDVNLFTSLSNPNANLGYLLGFSPPDSSFYFTKETHCTAESYHKLDPFKVVEIHCNLVKPAISNCNMDSHSHKEVDILHMFCPETEQINFGSFIAEQPKEINYIPINKSVRSINKIELKLKNESEAELDFCGAVIAYLKLIENGRT